jgi:hypothetical protein
VLADATQPIQCRTIGRPLVVEPRQADRIPPEPARQSNDERADGRPKADHHVVEGVIFPAADFALQIALVGPRVGWYQARQIYCPAPQRFRWRERCRLENPAAPVHKVAVDKITKRTIAQRPATAVFTRLAAVKESAVIWLVFAE